jgi:glycosyltransferase involved in cell wall biosynthesis
VGRTKAEHRAALDRYARDLGVSSHVEFLGPLAPREAWSVLSRCHVGVAALAPIANHRQSYPTKMFEYMSLGLPVVVSDFPLYRDVVERHGAGVCVDPEDPDAIAAALRMLADRPAEAHAMGQRGREAVRTTYRWDKEREKLFSFYRRLGVAL